MNRMYREWRSLLLPILLLAVALTLVMSNVSRPAALLRVWVPWAEIGTLAIAMTAVILAGGIDLSVGSVACLSMIVLGVLWRDAQMPIFVAALIALGVGTGCGLVNAGLVRFGLSPIIATVATSSVYSGLAVALASVGGESTRITGFPAEFTNWAQIGNLPIQFVVFALVAVWGSVIIHSTRFGRWCYAIGDNRLAAEFAAVPVQRVEAKLYALNGLIAAVVAILYVVQRDVAVADAFRGIELRVITCVVMGGTLISGGRGSIGRTILGILIVSHLDIGLDFMGTRSKLFAAETRLFIMGFLLVTLAAVNEWLAGK